MRDFCFLIKRYSSYSFYRWNRLSSYRYRFDDLSGCLEKNSDQNHLEKKIVSQQSQFWYPTQ